MRSGLIVFVLCLGLMGCAGIETATAGLKGRLQSIDLDAALDGLTDCDTLSDTFVNVIKDTVDRVDDLAESTGVAPPISDLREMVDEISVSRYYEIAERLGCARIQAQLDLVDKLRDLNADTASGDEFLEEMVDAAKQP